MVQDAFYAFLPGNESSLASTGSARAITEQLHRLFETVPTHSFSQLIIHDFREENHTLQPYQMSLFVTDHRAATKRDRSTNINLHWLGSHNYQSR